MIHKFQVSNFQSIREEISLDFRIPGTTPELDCFRRNPYHPEIRLPSVIAMFGPNGSGKTTLLRSLIITMSFAANSYYDSGSNTLKSFIPFLEQEMITRPTKIGLEFDTKWFGPNLFDPNISDTGSLYRYVLEIDRDDLDIANPGVKYESIYSFPKGRSRRLLERELGKPIYLAKGLKVSPSDNRLSAVTPEASAISAFDRMGVEPFPKLAQDLRNISTNIAGADPWRPDTDAVIRAYRENPELVNKVSEKLQRFDLGIKNLKISQIPDAHSDAQWMMIFEHQGLDVPVILAAESAGTRNMARMFPLINYVLETGGLAIMDSLDSDFHTELVLEILNWFRRKETNPNNAQLICSLHNPAILDDLEKEEVYIVEKDRGGVTRAYGLRNVQGLRRGGSLQRQYRSGSLGGLPTFG